MVKRTIPKILSTWLLLAGINSAIAASADWTEIAEADLKLMGNYVGEWDEAP